MSASSELCVSQPREPAEAPARPTDPLTHDEGGGSSLQWVAIAVLFLCWLAETLFA